MKDCYVEFYQLAMTVAWQSSDLTRFTTASAPLLMLNRTATVRTVDPSTSFTSSRRRSRVAYVQYQGSIGGVLVLTTGYRIQKALILEEPPPRRLEKNLVDNSSGLTSTQKVGIEVGAVLGFLLLLSLGVGLVLRKHSRGNRIQVEQGCN
jgi:hypothetical protein